MEIIVLRLVHILGGVFWVGSGLFSAFYLNPALAKVGPAAGAVMVDMTRRRLFVVMPIIALLTILSGLRLMWIMSTGFSAAYFASAFGATYAAAGGAAILAFLLGIFVMRPTGTRIGAIGAALAGPADGNERSLLGAEMAALQRRSAWANRVNAVLLLLAAAGMAVARYVV